MSNEQAIGRAPGGDDARWTRVSTAVVSRLSRRRWAVKKILRRWTGWTAP